jgi:hypothetical protein
MQMTKMRIIGVFINLIQAMCMRSKARLVLVSLCAGFVIAASAVRAQGEEEIIRFFQAGQEDGAKLATAYINPFVEGFSYALNGGWFHTAKPHKLGGFDINISMTPVFIPKTQDRFDPSVLNLSTVAQFRNLSSEGSGAPSVVGPKDETRYYLNFDLDGDGNVNTPNTPAQDLDQGDSFTGPLGLNLRKTIQVAPVGSPMFQVGIGLIRNTDIMVRFVPKTYLSGTEVRLLGVGLRHDIKQHIPTIKRLPFDVSLMAAYTVFQGTSDLSVLSEEFPPAAAGAKQEAAYTFNAFLLQALASKKFSFLTLFGGIGYNGIKTTADIRGSYVFFQGTSSEFELVNPYSAKFSNNSMRFDAGFRANILAFYLYSFYSFQEYEALTVGFGFTFR